jgi:NAD(P)-dependent dehydrogenase (short-subunit alcohol dehydrogenase family)
MTSEAAQDAHGVPSLPATPVAHHPAPQQSASPPHFARYPSLQGRCVLITGGATGIGASMVEHFVAQGAHVAFIDIDQAAGRALVSRLEPGHERGPDGHVEPTLEDGPSGAARAPLFVAADLTDIDALRTAIAQVRSHFGPIQVLVNNAANDVRHRIDATTPQSWDAGIAVNLKHQFFAAQAVAADMQQAGGGSIINLGSVSWMLKMGGMPVYTTAKAGVQGLTRGLARELGRHGIRVNTLVPGWVMTERQLLLWVDDAGRAEIARGQCIDQPLLPGHIARMALFLAADDSSMCTGQDFIVDGGWA